MMKRIGLALMLCGVSTLGWADQFHYNNVIVGDRAMGLGGAYTAIADDASGVYYNPAGLGFALSNDISGSANAYYTKKIVYEKAIGNEDFTERSGGNMAPFFGGLQKLDNLMPGLVAAFGIATLDADLKDQNDLFSHVKYSLNTGNGSKANLELDKLHRTVMQRANTSLFSAGIAKRFGGSFAMGLSVGYLSVDELVQVYQDNQYRPEGANYTLQVIQNVRQLLEAGALDIGLGAQWAFTNSWSLGAVVRVPMNLFQGLKSSAENYSYAFVQQCYYRNASNQAYTTGPANKTCDQAKTDGDIPADQAEYSTRQTALEGISRATEETNFKKPIGDWPMEYRLGLAWFATPRFLMSLDVAHKTASENGDFASLKRLAVTNYHYGMEYYVTPSLPLRLGLFTNFDARPKLDKKKTGQEDHIDYMGGSLFLAWAQPNSQVALGTVVQQGEGQAQKVGAYNIQNVKAFSGTLAFSATHNF